MLLNKLSKILRFPLTIISIYSWPSKLYQAVSPSTKLTFLLFKCGNALTQTYRSIDTLDIIEL